MIEINFFEPDFEKLEISKCEKFLVNDFLKSINNETLGRKVSIAFNLRKQGQFDKAMLNISEANRDQVLAIREIQAILDKLEGRDITEVIFEKFRQIFPFQIGLTNGEEVLNLLNHIKSVLNDRFPGIVDDLHHTEAECGLLTKEYTFFQERIKGRISEKELDEMRENISALVNKIVRTKKIILDNIIRFMTEKNITNTIDDRLKMVKSFYKLCQKTPGFKAWG